MGGLSSERALRLLALCVGAQSDMPKKAQPDTPDSIPGAAAVPPAEQRVYSLSFLTICYFLHLFLFLVLLLGFFLIVRFGNGLAGRTGRY